MNLTYRWAIFFFLTAAANTIEAQTYSSSGNRIEESVFREATASATDDVPLDDDLLSRLRSTSIAGDNPPFDVLSDLAMVSNEIYRNDHETIAYFVRGMGFDRFATITNDWHNLVVHVMSAPGVTLVVFRGTDDKLDWLFNLNLGTKTCAQGVFHLGFVNAYNAVRSDARSYISQQSGQRVWVTGHSLGGAMALLCGFDQKLHGDVLADVVTFGQPRITDTKGCQSIDAALKDRYVRVARPTDVVPRVPPAFFTAYGHAGMHIRLGNEGLTIGPSMTKTATQTAVQADRFGNICMVESVSTVHGSAFDEPPITLEELRSLPGHADHTVTDSQPVSFSPGAVAWAAFKDAIGKAIDWITEQHSMDEYLRLARSYRGR